MLEPKRYGGENRVKELVTEGLKKLMTYSEYTYDVVANYNAPRKDFDGNIRDVQHPIRREDFITNENTDKIKQLDQIISEMKKCGSTPENLNLRTLLDLMYQAALLIYSVKYEEKLKKRFNIA